MVKASRIFPAASKKKFKGARMRSWGSWVSEIRLPNTRDRLWLGSYSTVEQAARAFDVALVCLRGSSASLNFPDSPPPPAPLGLPHRRIQELAAQAAAAASPFSPLSLPAPFCSSSSAGAHLLSKESCKDAPHHDEQFSVLHSEILTESNSTGAECRTAEASYDPSASHCVSSRDIDSPLREAKTAISQNPPMFSSVTTEASRQSVLKTFDCELLAPFTDDTSSDQFSLLWRDKSNSENICLFDSVAAPETLEEEYGGFYEPCLWSS